jgi:hypothetical protein
MRAVLLSIFLAALVSLVAIPPLASALTFNRPLAYGSSGTDVSALQQYLQTQGYFHYPDITGYFGSYTWRALAAFQWDNNLESVGYLGPKTELALNKLLDQSLASLATSTSAAPTAPTATSTISLVPTPPPAPIYTTPPPTPAMGQPWQAVSGGGGGGPPAATPAPTPPPAPAPYVAKAVHFDGGTTYLTRTTPGPANSYVGAMSFWARYPSPAAAWTGALNEYYHSNGTGANSFGGYYPGDNGTDPSANKIGLWIELKEGKASGTSADVLVQQDHWDHYFFSWNTNFSQNNKIMNLYINGVSHADPALNYDSDNEAPVFWGDYSTGLHDTGDLYFPDKPGNSGPVELADLQMWVGTYIAPTPENLAKFISNGKPVDPAAAVAAFGQPSILFSGDATTFGTNQGSAGAFTTTGTLTNAATSPSN